MAKRPRVLPEVVSNHRRQAVKGSAHVGRLRVQPYAPLRGDAQHPGVLRRNTTPAPSSSSTSQTCDRFAGAGGSNSMNDASLLPGEAG